MKEHLRILRPFLRGLPLIVMAMLVGAMVAKKYLSYVTPMYESTAKLRLADIEEGVPNSNLYKDLDVFATSNKIAAEIEVMKSTELLLKTLRKLDFSNEISRVGDIHTVELYHESPLLISLEKPAADLLDRRFKLKVKSFTELEVFDLEGKSLGTGKIGLPLSLKGGTVLIQLNDSLIKAKPHLRIFDQYEFQFLSQQTLLEKVSKNLDISAVDKDVPVIRLNFKSNIPEKASFFINTLAETYIYDYIENKYEAAKTTVKFLDKQIETAGEKLADAENSIEDYRTTQHITNIRQETETDLRQISQMKIQLSNLKMNLEAIQQLNRYVENGKEQFLDLAPNFEAFTDLLSTELIKNIKKLQADKKDLLLVYTANDEKVVVIDQKIKDLTSYLIESIRNTGKNLQIKYSELEQAIAEAERAFEGVPEKEKNMTILTRQFDLMQSSYNFLNEKRIEAQIAQSAKIAFHRLISPATIAEKPVSPNRSIIVIVFTLIGMLGSIALIYTVHFMKAKVNDTYNIEQNSSIPIAISTPFIKKEASSVFSRNLIQLELKGLLQNKHILSISAFGKKEGLGYNTLMFCKTLSEQGRRVLLADMDGSLKQIRLAQEVKPGLFKTRYDSVLYTDLSAYTTSSLENFSRMFEQLKLETDLLLIHNEPLDQEARALLTMRLSDHNLVVVDSRSTALRQINRLELLKSEYNLPDLWLVLNRAAYDPNVLMEVWNWLKKKLNGHGK